MAIAPARIAGYSGHGESIRVGAKANLAVIDTSASWTVDRNKMASKSKNTPFHEMTLPSRVLKTFFNGELVFDISEKGGV